jgi:hypothetical protein
MRFSAPMQSTTSTPKVSDFRPAIRARQHCLKSEQLATHAYVCLGFRDHIVQRLEFDDHEEHRKNWNDTDDCAC